MIYKNRSPLLIEKLRTQIKDRNTIHTQVLINPGNHQPTLRYKTLRNELTSALRL